MKKSNQKTIRWLLASVQAGLLIILLYFGYDYHNSFEKNLTDKYEQQLSNQATSARLSVMSYFEKFTESLINLSHNPAIANMLKTPDDCYRKAGYCPLESLFEVHQHEIDALILMDTMSTVIKRIANDTANLTKMMCIGNPLANPDAPADSVYFSDIFINHKNQKAITISCPVFSNDKKLGILRWMMTIESINNHFLHNINRKQESHIVITDPKGSLLSSLPAYHEWVYRELQESDSSKTYGAFIYDFECLFCDGSGKIRIKPSGFEVYAGWSSLSVGTRVWKIVVMIPAKSLDRAMFNHGLITYGILGITLVIITSLFIHFYRTRMKKIHLETETLYLGKLADTQRLLKEEREKRLSAQITGQEQERKRISRELHDGLGQLLLSMRLHIKRGDYKFDQTFANELQVSLNETVEEVKRISFGLSPVILQELGIEKALNHYCKEQSKGTGIPIEFVSYGLTGIPDNEISIHLFRIVQEAIVNAIKHAMPTEINVQLLCGKKRLTLIIYDDGCGFDPSQPWKPGSNGIANMRDRTAILNGHIEFDSSPKTGTTVTVKIPHYNYGEKSNPCSAG